MLDITTNQASTNITSAAYCGYGLADEAAAAAELLLDEEMMDPLFEEDWLHENNLDILFDLFEEEIESKVGVETNSASSTLFGTSPVTSYLFGTSPSLASALDLIYFDNQQPSISNNLASTAATTTLPTTTPTTTTITAAQAPPPSTLGASTEPKAPKQGTYNVNGTRVVHNLNAARSQTSSMRIKRGLRKGQSEGVSLLAKPCLGKTNGGNTSGGSGNISRLLHKCQQHAHYITGRAVIQEHAYAVRGH